MKKRIALLSLLLLAGPAAAEIYRSVDANGRVTYSETPPQGRESQKVTPRVTPANTAEADALRQQMQSIDQERTEDGKKKADAAARAAEQAERCAKLKEAAQSLERNRPRSHYYSTNARGEREYWTEERRAEEQAKAQQRADKECNAS